MRRPLVLLLVLFALAPARAALADDLGVTRVQVTEHADGRIEVVAWVPLRLAPFLPPPELLGRGVFTAEGYLQQGTGGGTRFVFEQGDRRLAPGDVLLLPWQRQAVLARVELADGTSARKFFRRTGRGIDIPIRAVKPDRRTVLDRAQSAARQGLGHVVGGWVHLVLLVLLGLAATLKRAWSLLTAFLVGQLLAVVIAAVFPYRIGVGLGEIALVAAVAFVAHDALRPTGIRAAMRSVLAAAGLVHGLGLAALVLPASGAPAGDLARLLLVVLGVDAAQLVGVTGVALLAIALRRVPGSRRLGDGIAYAAGIGAVALAGLFALGDARAASWSTSAVPQARVADEDASSVAPITQTTPGSRLLAPKRLDAPLQSFLTVEPFEVRHDVLLRVREVADWTEHEASGDGYVEVAGQAALLEAVGARVAAATEVSIDGEPAKAIVDRVDFVEVTAQGTFPRLEPQREPVDEARIGVVVTYLTAGTPKSVTLRWADRPRAATEIPAAVTDPEASASMTLGTAQDEIRWENRLASDPIPSVSAVSREPPRLPIPWIALPMLFLALFVTWRVLRGRLAPWNLVFARVVLVAAVLAAPLATSAVALPDALRGTPSPAEAQQVLGSLLPNVYRSFSFRDESDIYDKLALSVTGEQLRDIYLQQSRSLEMAERGGARARVEAVEVVAVHGVEAVSDGGFVADVSWSVGGSVSHFGHRHFRQNRYRARITVVPDGDAWKIAALDVVDSQRVL